MKIRIIGMVLLLVVLIGCADSAFGLSDSSLDQSNFDCAENSGYINTEISDIDGKQIRYYKNNDCSITAWK